MIGALLVIAILIGLTALYVAAEFAAVAARRSRMRRLADEGSNFAARMLPILEDPHELDRYIAASQIGITLSSLVLGALGQATLAPVLSPILESVLSLAPADAHSAAAVVVLLILTALAMILGELLPKSLALSDPTRAALATVVPMQWSIRLFKPSIALLNGSGNLLLRLMRVPATGHRHVHSPEEIQLLINDSRDSGFLEPEEHQRLHHALALSRRTAAQLMVPRERIAGVDITRPVREIRQLFATSPFSRLIAYRRSPGHIVGMLHTKDVLRSLIAGDHSTNLSTLVRRLPTVPATMSADQILALLRERRSHQVLVAGEDGSIAGLITLEDVLAELFGGVPDEFKGAAPA
ncbi:MAG TPA: hemolysin family protein [Vicinamibacterales bacterium]|nr:hemolysin family protein [Vicinamibacterales bacterium]